MYYYTYKITLLKGSLAGHYYYGQHRTNNLNDGYAGSGKKVTDYYTKYGRIEHQTYIKDIIAFYNNDNELYEAEKQLIGDKFETDKLCLNLCAGGRGNKNNAGWNKGMPSWNRGKHMTEEQKEKIKNSLKGKHLSEERKDKISKSMKGRIPWNKGKTLPDSYKNKISEKLKGSKGYHWKKDPLTGKRIFFKYD